MTSSVQSSLISYYAQQKGDLLACIEEMLAAENIRSSLCEELRDKILTNTFNLVVVGQFKRGKTSLINALRSMLEEQVIIHIRHSFNTWRAMADERLAGSFENACKRFIIKIDDTVDSLLRYSSELFAVPFDMVKAEAVWSLKAGFHYKFRDEPVGIEILASTVTLALPKFIGDRLVLKKMKKYLHKAVSIQCGRIGYDFERRLDKSRLDFRGDMLQRIDVTIEGISAAIEKGFMQRTKSEQVVGERKLALAETAVKLNEIKEKLMRIRMSSDGGKKEKIP